jgi:hypothetical protein
MALEAESKLSHYLGWPIWLIGVGEREHKTGTMVGGCHPEVASCHHFMYSCYCTSALPVKHCVLALF